MDFDADQGGLIANLEFPTIPIRPKTLELRQTGTASASPIENCRGSYLPSEAARFTSIRVNLRKRSKKLRK